MIKRENETELLIGGKTFIDEVFEDNIKDRKILLNQNIDENTIEIACMQILKWNKEDRHKPKEDRKPIFIYINSCGGSALIGLNLVDIIKESETPVYGVVLSYGYSMGGVIFLACHKRYMFKNSSVLIHDGSMSLSGSAGKVKDLQKFYERIDEKIKQTILENSNITEEEYEDNADREQYLLSNECKEKGICDKIVGIDCNIDEVI